MEAPEVTVVMPCFNAQSTLREALASVGAQDFTAWELVAVNDGSTDATGPVLESWAQKDPRVKVLHCGHRGIVAALNKGIAAARGRYIARMDADDISLPQRLTRQVAFLEENPSVGLLGTQVGEVPHCQAQPGLGRYIAWTNSILTPEEHAVNRFIDAVLIHPTIMVRRELFQRYGTYRSEPAWPEDFELFLRYFQAQVRCAKVPEVLYLWREHTGRLTRTCRRYSPEAFYRCKAHYLAQGPLRGAGEVGIWGAGRVTRKRASYLEEEGIRIAFYVDIDQKKIHREISGRPVYGPQDLEILPDLPLLAYVASPGARDHIRSYLKGTRYREGENFWCAA